MEPQSDDLSLPLLRILYMLLAHSYRKINSAKL